MWGSCIFRNIFHDSKDSKYKKPVKIFLLLYFITLAGLGVTGIIMDGNFNGSNHATPHDSGYIFILRFAAVSAFILLFVGAVSLVIYGLYLCCSTGSCVPTIDSENDEGVELERIETCGHESGLGESCELQDLESSELQVNSSTKSELVCEKQNTLEIRPFSWCCGICPNLFTKTIYSHNKCAAKSALVHTWILAVLVMVEVFWFLVCVFGEN